MQIRWKAIEQYFLGNIEECIRLLKEALELSKENKQFTWVISDILIDIRNLQYTLGEINNSFIESDAQKELNDSKDEVYYPVLDRVNESLSEKYIESLYKNKIQSPYTVSMGNDFSTYGQLLASYYVIALYNGSLTHLLILYDKIKDFLFYLTCEYSYYDNYRDLLKYEIFNRKQDKVKEVLQSYPQILNNMNHDDSLQIILFCNNHTVKYKRIKSFMIALGTVGYYLNDKDFSKYQKEFIDEVNTWFSDDNRYVNEGYSIIDCLSGIAYRISQDILIEICCMFIDRKYCKFYTNLFEFMHKYIDIGKCSLKSAKLIIDKIIDMIHDESNRGQIECRPEFLSTLRIQNRELTKELDKAISIFMPTYYNNHYKINTTNSQEDIEISIKQCINRIKCDNKKQGENGVYSLKYYLDIATVRNLILSENCSINSDIMDSLIKCVSDTLMISLESIDIKIDAVSLLCCIIQKYQSDYERNIEIFNSIYSNRNNINIHNDYFLDTNIDKVSIKISLAFLFSAMGKEVASELLQNISYIQNDVATSISVAAFINEYFENSKKSVLKTKTAMVILQTTMQWLNSDNNNLRWNAAGLLINLLRQNEFNEVINQKIIYLVDNDNMYIKNRILRSIFIADGIMQQTKDYVVKKCDNDSNYLVRKLCKEVKEMCEADK